MQKNFIKLKLKYYKNIIIIKYLKLYIFILYNEV